MRVYVQWTLADPQDWQAFDGTPQQVVRAWERLNKRGIPTAASVVDNSPGWIFALNIQGIVMIGHDHYALSVVSDPAWGTGLRVTMWQDDPVDFPPGTRSALTWDLFDPGPDPLLGGVINTRQRLTVYAEPGAGYPGSDARPWSEFQAPTGSAVAHGIWVSDGLLTRHLDVATLHGWREWIA